MDFVPGMAFGMGTAIPAPDLIADDSEFTSPNDSISVSTPKIQFNLVPGLTGD